MFRILRPLRFISHNNNMKVAVKSLFQSFSSLIYVVVVIILFYIMFGILGINFFAGKMQF